MSIASFRVLSVGQIQHLHHWSPKIPDASTDAVTWETRFAWNTAQDRLSRRDKSNGVEISNGNLTSISTVHATL